MDTWTPITKQELESLVAKQLEWCTPQQKEFFSNIRIDFYKVPIHRLGLLEEVYIVAEHSQGIIYYEDVEEGFEIDMLGIDGAIPHQGCNQFDLRHVLNQLISGKPMLWTRSAAKPLE